MTRHGPGFISSARREKIPLEGDVPSPIDPPAGSAFGHRMKHPCYEETIGINPALTEIAPEHSVAAAPCCLTAEDWGKVRAKENAGSGQ